jgi:hypothetical protein
MRKDGARAKKSLLAGAFCPLPFGRRLPALFGSRGGRPWHGAQSTLGLAVIVVWSIARFIVNDLEARPGATDQRTKRKPTTPQPTNRQDRQASRRTSSQARPGDRLGAMSAAAVASSSGTYVRPSGCGKWTDHESLRNTDPPTHPGIHMLCLLPGKAAAGGEVAVGALQADVAELDECVRCVRRDRTYI